MSFLNCEWDVGNIKERRWKYLSTRHHIESYDVFSVDAYSSNFRLRLLTWTVDRVRTLATETTTIQKTRWCMETTKNHRYRRLHTVQFTHCPLASVDLCSIHQRVSIPKSPHGPIMSDRILVNLRSTERPSIRVKRDETSLKLGCYLRWGHHCSQSCDGHINGGNCAWRHRLIRHKPTRPCVFRTTPSVSLNTSRSSSAAIALPGGENDTIEREPMTRTRVFQPTRHRRYFTPPIAQQPVTPRRSLVIRKPMFALLNNSAT